MACDIRVASEKAKFGQPEVGLGIIASTGGLVRLARDINRKDCMELLLTGKKIKADEAKALVSSTTSCRPRKSWTRPSSWPKSA